MVGVPSAGNTSSTLLRCERGTFIIRPTRPAAAIAPFSSSSRRSILRRFHSSACASLFAMKRGVLSSTVSTTRNRFARIDEPVSETSTIASASSGGFTSVAP